MTDSFKRNIDYLRISLTDRCNLRCSYCMPREGVELTAHSEILSLEEVLRVSEIMAGLGIKKIRLTGGEPLLRKNLVWLVEKLGKIPGIEKLALTTNGVLLREKLPCLSAAGLKEVNISLDTLDRENYQKITGSDSLADVLCGIDAAYEAGLKVKINCVPVKELNCKDLKELAALSKDREIDVRFIELMPLGCGRGYTHIPTEEILKSLENEFGEYEKISDGEEKSVAAYVKFKDYKGRTGFISPLSHAFCTGCNRIRLSSEGFLKLCLAYDHGVDLRKMLRNSCSDEEIVNVIIKAVCEKPAAHGFIKEKENGEIPELIKPEEEKRNMNKIGG